MKPLLFALLFLFFTFGGHSQKVGLVLSGGGAKGMAHIGLIKVLEEYNIPIDYITGTSIGAIVGGLYASGMTPDEMIDLFNSDDFKLWSTGKMDKDDLYYFKRNDELPEWLSFDITKKGDKVKLILPFNIIPERQMDFAFLQLTAQTTAACNNDFDRLLVPFRCVSTDIYNNKSVIHRNGDLGEAIRASMTFPLVYKPIEKDGTLLFDGGISNNFPSDVMIEDFNPDIIIGHKVSNMGSKPDDDDLLGQIEAMVTQITDYYIPDSLGIVLETKLNDVSLFDFAKVNYANTKGIETGLLNIEIIQSLIERRVSKEELAKKREAFNERKPHLIFNNIQVEGVKDNFQRKYIIQSVKFKEKVIDITQLRSSYFKLIDDKHLKSIQPLAYYNRNSGLFDLHLKVETSKPLDVAFGGHLSTRSNTFGYLQANLKAFKKQSYSLNSNLYFGKFYNSFMLGGRIDSPNKIPFYVSGGFTINIWDYFSTSTDLIFTDIRPSFVKQTERNFKLEMGIPYTKTGVIDFGIAQSNSLDEYYQINNPNQGDKLDETTFNGYSGHIRIDKKNYDYKQYATEGGRKMFSIKYVDGNEFFVPGNRSQIQENLSQKHNYFQIDALYDHYYSATNNLSFGLLAQASINNSKLFSNFTSSKINASAFMPTPNSKSLYNDNFRANQYFAFGGKVIYQINDNLHLRGEAYGFAPIQQIMSGEKSTAFYHDKIFTSAHLMGLGAMVVQTRIGPLSVEVNYYDKPGQKWFFSVNMGYMLFNHRGF